MDNPPLEPPDSENAWWRDGLRAALALPEQVQVRGMSLADAGRLIDGLMPALPGQLPRAKPSPRNGGRPGIRFYV